MQLTLYPSNCDVRHIAHPARAARVRALLLTVLAMPVAATLAASPSQDGLRIATWNLEWLIAPEDFKRLKSSCTPEGTAPRRDVRSIPCDVASHLERSSRDFSVFARYASNLNADVVALEEVDGPSAARLVFPDYEFCFTGRNHVQNNGFAIRRGVPFRCGPDDRELSLGDTLRRGKELIVYPGEAREIRLLNVHLKSGCSAKPLTAPDKACHDLARQTPLLEAWIDAQAGAGRRFAVVGDFNRDLLSEEARGKTLHHEDSLWAEIADGSPPEAALRNAASGQPFRNCVPGQGYSGYIDNILLSWTLAAEAVPGSFTRLTYSAADARHAKLSDHCPLSIRVRIEPKAAPAG
jgi:endonuclease/exonuclease/phosphatase family metal-dependent hydrolase